jgi:hypothetical protein
MGIGKQFYFLGIKNHKFETISTGDLENDEEFYKGDVTTFVMKVSNMSELKRKEEDLPSTVH